MVKNILDKSRASAHTGVAIRIPLHTLTTKLPKKENGLPQVTLGHLRNDKLIQQKSPWKVIPRRFSLFNEHTR